MHLVRPSAIHCISTINSTLEIITVRFTEKAIENKREILWTDFCEYLPQNEEFEFIKSCAKAMIYYQKQGCEDLVNQNFNIITSIILKLAKVTTHTDKSEISTITKVLDYCEMHFRETPSLKEAAEYAGLSPAYLSSFFKKQMNFNYSDYINKLRLNYACGLLKDGATVTTACFSSGFSSLSAFNHTFKNKYNISPTEFIKEHYKK